MIFCDFNLDQMLPENVAKGYPFIQKFNLFQHSQYSTYITLSILDPIFDTLNSNTFSSLLSPYNDHFRLFLKNLMSLAVSNIVFNPHYITQKYLHWYLACYIFDGRVSEIFSRNNNQSKMIFLYLS